MKCPLCKAPLLIESCGELTHQSGHDCVFVSIEMPTEAWKTIKALSDYGRDAKNLLVKAYRVRGHEMSVKLSDKICFFLDK